MKNFKTAVLVLATATGVFISCSKQDLSVSTSSQQQGSLLSKGNMVLTPYGYVPSSHVHAVNSKTYGTVNGNGHVVIKDLTTGKIMQDLGVASAEDLKATGISPYTYAAYLRGESSLTGPSIVKNISNSAAGHQQLASVSTSPAQKAIMGTSYGTTIAGTNYPGYYLGADDITNIQRFSTTWTVPAKPMDTTNLVTYFLWNGLSGGALQPVLEWYNGRGAKYFVRNWYFTDGQYFHGGLVDVDPGTTLEGVITFVSKTDDTTWTYKESFTGYPDADVTFVRKSEATGLSECYEAYTSLLNRWPNQEYTAMTGINLTLRSGSLPDSINWTGFNDGPRTTPNDANSTVVNKSSSNGEVRFYYGDGTGITPDSTFQMISGVNGTSLLDVYASYTADGTKVELWTPNSPLSANQQWVPITLFNGYYKIASRLDTSKVLEVSGSGTADGTQADISTYTGADNQQWQIIPGTGGYCVLSPKNASSSALDDDAQGTGNGNKIQIYTRNSSVAQLWKFNYVPQ